MPRPDHATDPTDRDTPEPARAERPGRTRLYVAIGDRPPRWYRSPAEAADDARNLVPPSAPGDPVARAWHDEATADPPAWELRRTTRRGLAWHRLDPTDPTDDGDGRR